MASAAAIEGILLPVPCHGQVKSTKSKSHHNARPDSKYPYIYIYIFILFYLIYLFIYLSIFISLFIYLYIYIFIYLFIYIYLFIFVYSRNIEILFANLNVSLPHQHIYKYSLIKYMYI